MKAIFLFFISVFTILNGSAQVKGPQTGGGFSNTNLPGSNKSWNDVESAEISDDIYTYFTDLNTSSNSYTDYIHVNKFQLDIPTGKIITGIEVTVERSDPDQNTADYSVRILKYDIVTGNEKSTGDAYSATDSYKTFGGPTDLWGEVWTEDMINDNGFGIAISAQRIDGSSGTTNGRIDNITITIYYDNASTLPVSLINFTAKKNKSSIDLGWTTDDESNLAAYEIERSKDGRNFSKIASVNSKSSVSRISYAVTDHSPANGISYYRLKMVETDGSSNYSKIIAVQFATGNLVTVYPTLWKKGTPLTITNPNNERLTAYFITASGQQVGNAITTNSSLPVNKLATLKGIVYFTIANADGQPIGTGSLLID